MGTFLSLSGVIGRSQNEVVTRLSEFTRARDGVFEPRPNASAGVDIAVICEEAGNMTVLYPDGFTDWDEVSKFLSESLAAPVFSLHIHDGDLWMFIAFENGNEVAWFNPIPGYWEETTAAEELKWAGDAVAVARLASVLPDQISRYLVTWADDREHPTGKAYDDDEFEYCTDWQLTDFMKRIGLKYPILSNGTTDGLTYYLRLKRPTGRRPKPDIKPIQFPPREETTREPTDNPPWWKFW